MYLRPCAEIVFRGGWGGQCSQLIFSKLLQLFETGLVRLQVNMDKHNINSRRRCLVDGIEIEERSAQTSISVLPVYL